MIDFHNHLDLYPNLNEVVKEVKKRRIYLLSVTTTPSAFGGTCKLEGKNGRIRTALGLHPQLAHERFSELSLFDELLPATRYVGEVGLDGSKEYKKYLEPQSLVFEHILRSCSSSGGKILSVHSRGAAAATLSMLEKSPDSGIPVLHWFSGTKSELQKAINIGCWFSVGPAMLSSKRSVELVSQIPRGRLLTETDGPFAKLNNRTLMPWDAYLVVQNLAALWGVDPEALDYKIHDNLKKLVSAV